MRISTRRDYWLTRYYGRGINPATAPFTRPEVQAQIVRAYKKYRQFFNDYSCLPHVEFARHHDVTCSFLVLCITGFWLEPICSLTFITNRSIIRSERQKALRYDPFLAKAKWYKPPIAVFGCHQHYYLMTHYGVGLFAQKEGVPYLALCLSEKSRVATKKGISMEQREQNFSLQWYVKNGPGRVPFLIVVPAHWPKPEFAVTHAPLLGVDYDVEAEEDNCKLLRVYETDRIRRVRKEFFVVQLKPDPNAIGMLCAYYHRIAEGKKPSLTIVQNGFEEELHAFATTARCRYRYPCADDVEHGKVGRAVRDYCQSKAWQISKRFGSI